MDPAFLLLASIVFVAALLQAATGVGFGVIGGPVLLVALNSGDAIQISILLNLLIAVLMTPAVWRKFERDIMRNLLLGLVVGSPVGLMLFLSIDLVVLKVLAAICVFFTLALLLMGHRMRRDAKPAASHSLETLSIGVIAGIMGTSLAMPGPVPAAWMAIKDYAKEAIRSTNLVMFIPAYSIALVLQYGMLGMSEQTTRYTLVLAVPTVAGVIAGALLSGKISESLFRRILIAVLAGTIVSLLATLKG